ncbi:MAG: type II toxin-antitoxin system RelE/ParE family toxin [Spirochaetaceae bacterium]|nr:type II toxin-antitoxin system RelE/ParE family toxin [Spirochaetaceae bacterium]
MQARLQTVVETPAYLAAARRVLSQDEQDGVASVVAENPTAGVAIGGGVRKMRFARSGGGKRGGVRVIFLFSGVDIPVFLLALFAKNEKVSLSPRERSALITAAKRIAEDYRRRK